MITNAPVTQLRSLSNPPTGIASRSARWHKSVPRWVGILLLILLAAWLFRRMGFSTQVQSRLTGERSGRRSR